MQRVDRLNRAGRRRIAQRQGFGLDAVQQIHDAAVFQPGLVVQKAAQLLRQLGHGALRVFARLQPVVVHAAQAGVGRHGGYWRQCQYTVEQLGQLFLARLGHQKIPKRTKALALVRVADRIALAHDVLQQVPLSPSTAAAPHRNALPHPAVQHAKVVLHLAEIRQQIARQAGELLKPVFQRGVVQQRHVAAGHQGDFCVNRVAALVQFSNARLGVGVAALAHLLEQLKQGQQARLGADEGPVRQADQPRQCALSSGGEVEMRLV